MTGGIDTETIHTHLDELTIALHEIICHRVVLCIQVYAVTGNLTPPTGWIIPTELAVMVPVVVNITVLTVHILHHGKTTMVLILWKDGQVVTTQSFCRGHTSIDVSLVAKLCVTIEQLAELLLTEVTGVVEHDVKNDLDTLFVSLVDEFLEHHVTTLTITALIAAVNMLEIHSMIAVVVITGCVLYYRSNPDGSETKSLDVVELVDNTLEVASPARVFCFNLRCLVVPAEHIVFRITIVETSGNHEIDTFVSEVSTIVVKRFRCHRLQGDQHEHKDCP